MSARMEKWWCDVSTVMKMREGCKEKEMENGGVLVCVLKKCYVGAELLKKNSLLYKCKMLRLRKKVSWRPKKWTEECSRDW